jgi:autotransporter-associated beta strand protein
LGSSNAGGNTDAASATPATSSSTWSIGSTGASQTIDGIIGNGVATSTGSGFPLAARSVTNTNLTKVGAGTMTLNGANVHNGANTIAANGGKIVLGNQHALGDGRELVTVNSGGTLDLNGQSQVAGKMYSLNGGSLLNDNASVSATLSSGASVSLRANTGASGNGGTGAWKGGDGTTLNQNTNAVPSVTVSAPNVGSNQATAHVLLQLGYLRGNSDGAAVGSGYTSEPKISFSAPDLAGGRPIKAVAFINASGQVAGVTIIDPGFGYTKMPTITIDDTGTGGSGFKPTWYMTAGAVLMDNGGADIPVHPRSRSEALDTWPARATPSADSAASRWRQPATSRGAGNLVVDAVASGVGGLNRSVPVQSS